MLEYEDLRYRHPDAALDLNGKMHRAGGHILLGGSYGILVTIRVSPGDEDMSRLHTLIIDLEQSKLSSNLVVAPHS